MKLKDRFLSSRLWDASRAGTAEKKVARAVLAVLLLGALIGGALAWWVPWQSTTAAPDARQSKGPLAVNAGPSAAPVPSSRPSCPEATGADIASAPVASWELKGTAYVPLSQGPGPCSFTGQGAPAGFSHSQTGALFAAQWYAGALDVSGTRPGWEDRIRSSVLDAPGRPVMLEAAKAVASHTGAAPVAKDARIQTSGYRLVSYTDTQTVLELVISPESQTLSETAVFRITLAWTQEDWKVVPTLDGRLFERQQAPKTWTGFIAWGADGFAGLFTKS